MSTARELGFTGRLSPDPGRDSGGIYRDITREFRIPDVLSKGSYSEIDWHNICINSLATGNHHSEMLKSNIPHTVIFEGNTIKAYLYTDIDGFISHKPHSAHNMKQVQNDFIKTLAHFQGDDIKYAALATIADEPDLVPISLDEFNSYCATSPPAGVSALSVYIPSKGNKDTFRTYLTSYSLDKSGRSILRTEKLDLSAAASGVRGRTTKKANMNKKANTFMEDIVQHTVYRIQQSQKCSVVKLEVEFVEDVNGHFWLLRARRCLTATPSEPSVRSVSPDLVKHERSQLIAEMERTGSAEYGSRPTTSNIGRHSDDRVSRRGRRLEKELSRNEAAVEEIMKAGVRRSTSPSRPFSQGINRPFTNETPNARLGRDVPIIGGPVALGTTQREGCAGDFCHINLSNLEGDAIKGQVGPRKVKLSEFRRKLVESAEDDMDDDILSAKRDVPVSDSMGGASGTGDGADDKENPLDFVVPYRMVIQSRQEMPLVRLMLKRYKRGEDGDYVAEDSYSDLAISNKLPAHYYKDVQCCRNCYKVYGVIDQSRTKALAKIQHKRDKKARGRSLSPESRAERRLTANANANENVSYDLSQNNVIAAGEDATTSLNYAVAAIDNLTKMDVAEIRTMVKPPPAVEIVLEAVMSLLTGKVMSFQDTKRLLGGGEAFLLMLREFRLDDVTDERLRLVEPYVDNPIFRPQNVVNVSHCASKFCAWVLGIVQAARWHRGTYHHRTGILGSQELNAIGQSSTSSGVGQDSQELTFVEKLERKRAKKGDKANDKSSNRGRHIRDDRVATKSVESIYSPVKSVIARGKNRPDLEFDQPNSIMSPSPIMGSKKKKKMSERERIAMAASQKKAAERLSSHNKTDGNTASVGNAKVFRCADGVTKIPYIVLGNLTLESQKCNFLVIHDFFDTCDGTAINFKPIIQRHNGCQIFCYNYPGQAHTVWPRAPDVERKRGAKDPILNNDWQALRLHEVLQYAEQNGDILLTNPFHLVGIGGGMAIAAAFAQRFGSDTRYNSLKSIVNINGFLYPDPQLSSILHSASKVFESTPHTRPDIPVSYWCRFIFSESYLTKVNSNLALNIYTAVSNPITNEGRMKLTAGCLRNRDLRGGLHPDLAPNFVQDTINSDDPREGFVVQGVKVPVICLQSTENMLVNAANVDPFLVGRNSKNLWSHQLNILSESALSKAQDVTALWVGKRSSGPEDYSKFSLLGRNGLTMLLDAVRNPRAGMVIWTRSGHNLIQENKTAMLDLLDALACPMEAYYGLEEQQPTKQVRDSQAQESKNAARMEVLFKIEPPKRVVDEGLIEDLQEEDEEEEEVVVDLQSTLQSTGNTIISDGGQPSPAPSSFPTDLYSRLEEVETSVDLGTTKTNIDAEIDVAVEAFGSPTKSVDTAAREEEMMMEAAAETSPDVRKDVAPASSLEEDSLDLDTAEPEVEVETLMRWNRGDQNPTPSAKPMVMSASAPTPTLPDRVLPDRYEQSSTASKAEVNNLSNAGSTQSDYIGLGGVDATSFDLAAPSVDFPDPTSNFSTASVSVDDRVNEDKDVDKEAGETSDPPVSPSKTVLDNNVVGSDYPEFMDDIATKDQRKAKQWTDKVPDSEDLLLAQAEMEEKRAKFADEENNKAKSKADEAMQRLQRIKEEQARRRKEYEDEDNELLAKLEEELNSRRAKRAAGDKQRRIQMQELEKVLVEGGVVPDFEAEDGEEAPVMEMHPMPYDDPVDLPKIVTEKKDPASVLERMLEDEEEARKRGIMSVEEFEKVKSQMALRQMERDQKLRHLGGEEQHALFDEQARLIQRAARGYNGRKRARKLWREREMKRILSHGALMLQARVRGMRGRRRFNRIKSVHLLNLAKGESANRIQKLYRGVVARRFATKRRHYVKARHVQRAFRGHVGRMAAARERKRLEILRMKKAAASKIQASWRMKVAREEFRSLRIHMLAATEIQRLYRGHLGRKIVERRKEWEAAEPGPERVKLGLKLIEESKLAFERQQEEIDALHRAQERAEARVSHIHAELKESEKELVVLEKELQEIDQIERDLQALTHERDLLTQGIRDAAGMPRIAREGHENMVVGQEATTEDDPDLERRKKAEAYALEMTIQIKRAEREKKRQELETEFAAVFQEVEKKKKALQRLEASLSDMEATRERKDREFRRLQKNLMQLLLEQKQELDDLREKGIELETATATTAAAATATALKAKEHEQRSTVMFSQTEELMKFQFMSMSLSYFSSLNMLKQLRDMNADTTSAAVASSADAAAAAAASAAAANMPSMKKLDMGADDFVEVAIQKKKAELAASEAAEKATKAAKENPMPDEVRLWSVIDVCKWLETLSLGQYQEAFKEATVDGPFLMELREEDMVQILGIRHKLHVRKILVSREKLKPLSEVEKRKRAEAEREAVAEQSRAMAGAPDLDTVFSQARNARNKRCEESLNMGFPIDAEDERGNTLLLIAAQNCNKRLLEMLIIRGSNVNHQNALGNTALHFALAFDASGTLGEYLIEHGADDTIENVQGMSPYDGVASDNS